jgi:hypothetical protein
MPSGEPTQGDIWTNLPYPTFNIAFKIGLLITPRCDFAHEKAKVFSYVPALDFDTYLERFGYSRILSEEINRQHNALKDLDVDLPSFSLMEIGVPVTEVLRKTRAELLGPNEVSTKTKAHFAKFEKVVTTIKDIKRLMAKGTIAKNEAVELIRQKDILRHSEMIVRNQISDLHFMPSCPPVIEKPLILLLRYVFTCQIEFLTAANRSVNDEDWNRTCRQLEDRMEIFRLCHLKPDRILRLRSPYLESLMSRIAFLYLRVGVPDFPKSEYDNFLGALQ